jgi:uncharacterized protein (DUF1330 family)
MIVFCRIHDRRRFIDAYANPTAALIPKFGGQYLVRAPRAEALEGAFGDGMASVISKWPDRASLDRFYASPEYAPLKAARAGIADCSIVVVEDPQ